MSGIETAAALAAAGSAAGGGAAAAGAGAAGVGAAGAAGAGALGAGAAGATGALGAGLGAATGVEALGATGAMLAPEAAATGSLLYPGTASAATASGLGAPVAAPATSSMMFTTPSVTGGPLSGALSGTTLDYGTAAGLAEANTAAAGQPGMLAQMGGYAKGGMKAASTYSSVNRAMGGGQPQHQAPAGRPVFQGEQAPIASGMGDQPEQNQNAVLAAIARRRQRGF